MLILIGLVNVQTPERVLGTLLYHNYRLAPTGKFVLCTDGGAIPICVSHSGRFFHWQSKVKRRERLERRGSLSDRAIQRICDTLLEYRLGRSNYP